MRARYTSIALFSLLPVAAASCGLFAAKDQQDAVVAKMAPQKEQFAQTHDGEESRYTNMRSKLELAESQYQDWLQEVTASQKKSNEFAAVSEAHDELKGNVDKLEADHGALVEWYEKTKDAPSNDDQLKLGQSYGAFGQKQQLYYSSYVDLNTRSMSISTKPR